MAPRKGTPAKMTEAMMREAVEAVAAHGSIKAASEAMKLNRQAVQNRIDHAVAAGLTKPRAEANPSRWRPFDEVRQASIAQFERIKAAGDGRKLNTIHMPDGPYCLIALGDPHLDSPGTDLKLWERWIAPLDHTKQVYAIGLGDWTDNWLKFLSFIYGSSEITAPDGWTLLEGYLNIVAPHMLVSVSGNHDDWSGYTDLLGHLMRERRVLHRANGIRVALRQRSGRQITIGLRHRFLGNSQWNPAHAVTKAAQMGWRDTLLIGGDKHISGSGLVRCPDTGRLTWAVQVAAFKTLDDYGDQLGLMDKHVSPAVAFVVDPAREDTDPQLVTMFYEPEAAVDYLAFLRRKK